MQTILPSKRINRYTFICQRATMSTNTDQRRNGARKRAREPHMPLRSVWTWPRLPSCCWGSCPGATSWPASGKPSWARRQRRRAPPAAPCSSPPPYCRSSSPSPCPGGRWRRGRLAVAERWRALGAAKEMGLLCLRGRGIFVRGRFRSRWAGDSRSRGLRGQRRTRPPHRWLPTEYHPNDGARQTYRARDGKWKIRRWLEPVWKVSFGRASPIVI